MHELALAEEIIQLVEAQARRDAFARVTRVRLVIGALAQVEAEALQFGFESVRRGTVADGATLEIDRPAGTAHCLACDSEVPLERRGDACPRCGSSQVLITGGEELRVAELEVQ